MVKTCLKSVKQLMGKRHPIGDICPNPGPISSERIPTSAHQTYDRNKLLNIQNGSTKFAIPLSTWNILNDLKINCKPVTLRGSRDGIRKLKNS